MLNIIIVISISNFSIINNIFDNYNHFVQFFNHKFTSLTKKEG